EDGPGERVLREEPVEPARGRRDPGVRGPPQPLGLDDPGDVPDLHHVAAQQLDQQVRPDVAGAEDADRHLSARRRPAHRPSQTGISSGSGTCTSVTRLRYPTSAVRPPSSARRSPSDSPTPATYRTSTTSLRSSLTSRSVPMLPGPRMPTGTFPPVVVPLIGPPRRASRRGRGRAPR